MDGFNLLPEEYRTRRGARFVPISMLVVVALGALAILLMELAMMRHAARGSGSLLGQTLADRRVELAQMRQQRAAVERDIESLGTVLARTPVWSNLFVDVASVLGPGIRIERWSSETERGFCSIQGRASTNSQVFALLTALEELDHFESVALAGVTKESDEEGRGVRYEIVCRLRQAAR
jgi:Tfp pilus assembly protein PilN